MSQNLDIKYTGVTFDNLRAAICAMYFQYEGMPQEEWREALRYVVPMQHNFENPIEPGSQDTWIQFWIDEDERLTQDYNTANENVTMKVAIVSLRFLGVHGETWAKAFHHLTKRRSAAIFFAEYCNATPLEYVSPIIPMNVDYFGAGNTTIAFDITFDLHYNEVLDLNWEPLEYVSFPEGGVNMGGQVSAYGGGV